MMDQDFSKVLLYAIAGDEDALQVILHMYDPIITKYSYVHGSFDEDLKQYLHISIALNISKFRGLCR